MSSGPATKVAVLGVGLIGGSIGLAARRRLGAEVVGFGRSPERLARAVELGALDRAADSVAAACAGAELVVCAGPVAALAEQGRAALAASGPETVVTDVGSTKRELVAALGEDERFIGGHPLAGAETAGVENAREDLFDGARWYLTPTERSGGLLYDRLQRTVTGLGARPQAIDPAAHDRLMATVSHLPHVLANALAAEAAEALSRDSERLPEVGPSFRDATRVAGSNPAIWADIFASNRDAVADSVESVARRLEAAAALIRGGERDAVGAWHAAAGADRRRLLEGAAASGPLRELRIVVANRPGTIAQLALALGEAGVNIEDMALYPAPDMTSGAVSLWVAGEEQAGGRRRWSAASATRSRSSAPRGRLGPRMTRFDPSGPLRGSLRPPADKSISHRAALIAAMGEGRDGDLRLPRRRRHPLDPGRGAGAGGRGRRRRRRLRALGRPAPRRGAAADRRGRPARPAPAPIEVGNAGTLLRLLPGWLAGQEGGEWRLDGDDSIRRRPVDRIAEPLRLMGARIEATAGRLPPFTVSGAPLRGIDYEMPIASAQVKSCLLFAGLLAGGETRVVEPHPSRDHTERMLRARPGAPAVERRRRRARLVSPCSPPPGSNRARSRSPPTSPRPPSSSSPRPLVAGSEVRPGGGRGKPDPDRAADDPGADGGGDRARAEGRARRRADRPPRGALGLAAGRPRSAAPRCRWRSTSCRWWRSPPASPRGRRRSATPRSCGARSPTGSRPSRRRCGRSAARSSRPRTGS